VVIPCYNYGRFLPLAVHSALSQRGVDVEVIVVDDCSTDESQTVAQELARLDARVRLVLHESNRGHITTYNDGLRRATGEYVVLLSADDLLTPGSLQRSVALMEAHPRVGFVYGYARAFTGTPPDTNSRLRSWTVWKGTDWLRVSARKGRCFISNPEVVMRRDALLAAGGYDPRLPHSADFDMWMRTAVDWDVGRVNGPSQAWYRVHDSNMHLTTFAGWITDLRERRATFDILFDERAPGRPEMAPLRPRAMRALATESLRRGLVAYRDGADPDQVTAHLDFALETYPAISSSWLWMMWQVAPLRGRRFPGVQTRRFLSRVRHHLAWRHERRYGT
jgi:glycosyltransferase involved in cell wall biosynthesis